MIEPIDILLSVPGIVIFNIADKEFCADIRQVYKILKINEAGDSLQYDERKSPYICINDIKFPIIDLHKIFGFKRKKKSPDARILFVEINSKIFGFFVEKIKEFVTINKKFNMNYLNSVPYRNKIFIKGILNYEGRTLYFPDFQKIDMAFHSFS